MRAQIHLGRCKSSILSKGVSRYKCRLSLNKDSALTDCNLKPNSSLFASSLSTFHELMQKIRSVYILYTCSVFCELL